MRFHTVIVGGGLSGLVAGVTLARTGKRVAIVSSGQSSLHFNGGSLELLGALPDGTAVQHPLEAAASLPEEHPYAKIGVSRLPQLAADAAKLLATVGMPMQGDVRENHYRLTPMGVAKPAWLTMGDYVTLERPDVLPWNNVLLVNVAGFMDFPVNFVAHGLREMGATVRVEELDVEPLAARRASATEMRAANLAKSLVSGSAVSRLASAINEVASDNDEVVLIPAVLGLDDDHAVTMLRAQVSKPLHMVATLPPAVPGARLHTTLRHYFQMLGGTYLMGDTVQRGTFEGNRLTGVHTAKLADTVLQADNYVMAGGSFLSRGLMANYERVYEPVLDLDVTAPTDRAQWTRYGVFNQQPYMSFGVSVDRQFHALKGGEPLDNVYAVGSILGGHDPVKMGDGTGVAMLTALAVAQQIIDN